MSIGDMQAILQVKKLKKTRFDKDSGMLELLVDLEDYKNMALAFNALEFASAMPSIKIALENINDEKAAVLKCNDASILGSEDGKEILLQFRFDDTVMLPIEIGPRGLLAFRDAIDEFLGNSTKPKKMH